VRVVVQRLQRADVYSMQRLRDGALRIAKTCAACLALATVLSPGEARADGYVTPWIGIDFATANDDGSTVYGVTTGYMGAGVFGFEADVGFTPHLFRAIPAFDTSTGLTIMGNFILGIPIGGTHGAGIRPFVSGGVGLMRIHSEGGPVLDESRSNNEFGYDLGAGMMGFFNQHVGLRGDVRYIRSLDSHTGIDVLDGERLRYWRVVGGVTFR
jgi:hypothetical protein